MSDARTVMARFVSGSGAKDIWEQIACMPEETKPGEWVLHRYFTDGTDTYHSYGNDPADEDPFDGPDADAEILAWRLYYEYVARTGEDPIHECTLPRQKILKRKFVARVMPWIGQKEHGPALVGVTPASHGPRIWRTPCQNNGLYPIPQAVWDYLGTYSTGTRWTIAGFESLQALREAIENDEGTRIIPIRDRSGRTPTAWLQFEFTVDCPKPIAESTLRKQLKAWAHEQLKRR